MKIKWGIIKKDENIGVWNISYHRYCTIHGWSEDVGIYHDKENPDIDKMIEYIKTELGEDVSGWGVTQNTVIGSIMFENPKRNADGYYLLEYTAPKKAPIKESELDDSKVYFREFTPTLYLV